MNSTIKRMPFWNWSAAVLALWMGACALNAQDALKDLLFTVGTTTTNRAGADWAYVAWGSASPELLIGKRYAVYAKTGDAASPATLTKRGVAERVSGVSAVTPIYNRALNVGENPGVLTNTLRGLFSGLSAFPSASVPQQVAFALDQSLVNSTNRELLNIAARVHPAVNLSLGLGWAEPMSPNQTLTFEIREIDPVSGSEQPVVGRVTVTAGQAVVLPAPDRPAQVPDATPMGDLNIRLRWAEPIELRRLTLMSHGFNLWRLPKAVALNRGWVETPPTMAVFLTEPTAKKVNNAPSFKKKDFEVGNGAGSASDLATDPTTYFFADDNGLGTSAGQSFNDGEEFYYFITARDLLGRDGLLSKGGLGLACRRLPAPVPRGVRVENDYDASRPEAQRLLIEWRQNSWQTGPDIIPDLVTHYAIYRWTNHSQIHTNEYSPASRLVKVVPHIPGAESNQLLDDGAGAPKLSANGDRTFWYTVRAVKSNQCGLVFSGNSAPAFGVLRTRDGLDGPDGDVAGSCGTLMVVATNVSPVILPQGTDRSRVRFHLSCVRRDESISWAEFTISNAVAGSVTLPRRGFAGSDRIIESDFDHAGGTVQPVSVITCQVGDDLGRVSILAVTNAFVNGDPREVSQQIDFLAGTLFRSDLSASDPLLGPYLTFGTISPTQVEYLPGQQVKLCFNVDPFPAFLIQRLDPGAQAWADVYTGPLEDGRCIVVYDPHCRPEDQARWRAWPMRLPTEGDCDHVSHAGDSSKCLTISMNLRPGTREWRVYRCLDDGPQTLISQGATAYNAAQTVNRITVNDCAMPPVSATACYYGQLIDANGNASPVRRLGKVKRLVAPPPTPMLAAPEGMGTLSAPKVTLRWFCPPAGVDRFRIHIVEKDAPAPAKGSTVGAISSLQLKKVISYTPVVRDVISSSAKFALFIPEVFETGRVGGDFQPGPNFELIASVRAGVKYAVFIEALNGYPTPSPSLVYEFTWQPPPEPKKVAWPARGLPPVKLFDDAASSPAPSVDPRVRAVKLVDPNIRLDLRYPVGVVIGELPPAFQLGRVAQIQFNTMTTDPAGYSYTLSKITPNLDPNSMVYHRLSKNPDVNGQSLLPIVVYRQQVANSTYPRVSGNVTQVTPLLEEIAWKRTVIPNAGTVIEIPDRLIGIAGLIQTKCGAEECTQGGAFIVLRDTQPVLKGATYRYFVVRLKANRELDQIIPAGEVTIPFDL